MAKKLPKEQHVVRTSLTTDREIFERVEDWRVAQRPPLTRSAAWRALADRALDVEAKRDVPERSTRMTVHGGR